MEQPFGSAEQLPRADISLCVFPHLRQFLLIDVRRQPPTLQVLHEAFLRHLESAFSTMLREATPYPFLHLMSLPARVEEALREAALEAILERAAVAGQETPRVAVFIVSGPALSLSTSQLTRAFRQVLGLGGDPAFVDACVEAMERLARQEREAVREEERQGLREVLRDDSPHFYTLWENPA